MDLAHCRYEAILRSSSYLPADSLVLASSPEGRRGKPSLQNRRVSPHHASLRLKSKKCTSLLFPPTSFQAENLRFLVHLIGDIHQPLHILNYFDSSFPSGDQSTLSSPFSPRRQPLLRARARQKRVASGQSPRLDGRLRRVFLRLQGIARRRPPVDPFSVERGALRGDPERSEHDRAAVRGVGDE